MVRAAHSLLVLASLVATCLSQGIAPPPPSSLTPPCLPLPQIPDPTTCDVTCLVASALHVKRAFTSMQSQLKVMRQAAYYQTGSAGSAGSGATVDLSALTNLLTDIQASVDAINPEVVGLIAAISNEAQPFTPAPAAPDAGAGAPPV